MDNKFGERLKLLRKEHGLTQKKLAEKIGVTNQNVNDWESGKSETSFDNLLKIAELFEVSIDYLLGKDDLE